MGKMRKHQLMCSRADQHIYNSAREKSGSLPTNFCYANLACSNDESCLVTLARNI